MIKLDSIHIEEMRGIRKLDIDFQRGTFAISGPNGSGKSGVIDAIEFGLTGQIGRLTGRGTKGLSVQEHGPHVDKTKFPDAAFVEMKLFLPDLKKSVTVIRKVSDPKKPKIGLSYTWVKQALQTAGLVKRKARRGVHRKRRERRPLPGMMLHVDGSEHRWFQDERRHDLIVILDDATSEIYYAQLAEEETTAAVMAGLRAVIEQKGLFCSLYSDRGAHFWLTPKSGGKVDYERPTQVGRAMKELGVHMIPAYSPQARGRSERNFSTWQGRLPQELRLRGIRTLEGANKFLNEHYIADLNRRFTVPAAQRGTAFISCRHRNLEMVFTQRFERTVDQDNTVRFHNLIMQIERAEWRPTLAGCKVIIHQHLDTTLTLMIAGHRVGHYSAEGKLLTPLTKKQIKAVEKTLRGKVQKPTFPLNLQIPHSTRDSHFPTASTTTS